MGQKSMMDASFVAVSTVSPACNSAPCVCLHMKAQHRHVCRLRNAWTSSCLQNLLTLVTAARRHQPGAPDGMFSNSFGFVSPINLVKSP